MRTKARAEIETGVLRGIGAEGVAVTATVAACRPALAVGPAGASLPDVPPEADAPAGRACTEAEASPVTLCATIPANATITEVALFSRLVDAETPWSASRLVPGQESVQARFAEKYSESAPEAGHAPGVPGIRALVLRSRPRGARDRALLSIIPRYLQSPLARHDPSRVLN